MLILSGCTSVAQRAQTDAGASIGRLAAGIETEAQPGECGRPWPLLTYARGDEAIGIVARYEDYVLRQINPQKLNCFEFNRRQYEGLEAGNGR